MIKETSVGKVDHCSKKGGNEQSEELQEIKENVGSVGENREIKNLDGEDLII